MKYLEIIIRPGKYQKTKEMLVGIGVNATFSLDALGRGGKMVKGYETVKGEDASALQYIAKKYIGIYIPDERADEVIRCILEINSTGNPGDGKIFIYDVDEVVRISTGQRGEDALY